MASRQESQHDLTRHVAINKEKLHRYFISEMNCAIFGQIPPNKLNIVLPLCRSEMEVIKYTYFQPTVKSGMENLSHMNRLWHQWAHFLVVPSFPISLCVRFRHKFRAECYTNFKFGGNVVPRVCN